MGVNLVRIGVPVPQDFLTNFLRDAGICHQAVERVPKAVETQIVPSAPHSASGFQPLLDRDFCLHHDALERFAQSVLAPSGLAGE